MKTNQTRWMALSAVLLLAIPFVARSQNQTDQVPAAINYQGHLADTLGNAVPSGYYEIQFRIWNDATMANPGNLIWGRSFPLHVVTNGLFNILLTDDGGLITTPTTPTNSLLDAFSGSDRYLGLTITTSNGNAVTESEISPRQQLASAPFAIQAQTANAVVAEGIQATMLQSESVTTPKIATSAVTTEKIADNAVTEAKIADNAVTTSKIANGAVTSAKLNIDADYSLNGHDLLLEGSTLHGLGNSSPGHPFGAVTNDGPVLYGYQGGTLGTTRNSQRVAELGWDFFSGVSLFGSLVDLSSHVQAAGTTPVFTANADGFMMYYGRRGAADLQVWSTVSGTYTNLFDQTSSSGATFYFNVNGADGRSVMWPLRRGDKFRWFIREVDTVGEGPNNKLYFLPFGLNQGAGSISQN
jgi:hypothetical protein